MRLPNGNILFECEQGSEDWHRARCGSITASMFSTARAKLKRASGNRKAGEFGDTARNYAFQLACERIIGEPLGADWTSWQAQRGSVLESAARGRHSFEIGLEIKRAGIVKTEDETFAGSPDGLIGDDGGAEYKCLIAPGALRSVIFENDISEYLDQIHGNIWLTGRQWWDFGLYCPQLDDIGLGFVFTRIYRDEKYIAELVSDLQEFEDTLVNPYIAKLEQIGRDGWDGIKQELTGEDDATD